MHHINDAPDTGTRLTLLQEYEHDSVFLKYLRIALGVDYKFSPDLGFGYPEHVRLNRDFPDGISDSALRNEHRQFYLYQDTTDLDIKRRMFQFGGMLEVIHYTEADLIIAIKDGKFNKFYPNVTYELASLAFPEMFPVKFAVICNESNNPLEVMTEPYKLIDSDSGIPEEIQKEIRKDLMNQLWINTLSIRSHKIIDR